jgi:hypothetical protein
MAQFPLSINTNRNNIFIYLLYISPILCRHKNQRQKIFKKRNIYILTNAAKINIIIFAVAVEPLAKIDEAWLSLVERCVRDAEAAGSNPVASTTKHWILPSPVFFYFKNFSKHP